MPLMGQMLSSLRPQVERAMIHDDDDDDDDKKVCPKQKRVLTLLSTQKSQMN